MSNFTPGPWELNKYNKTYFEVRAKGRYGSIFDSHYYNDYDAPPPENICKAEAMANVHLLMAAPELLEALEAIVKASWQGDIAGSNELYNQAEAAINKAKGLIW